MVNYVFSMSCFDFVFTYLHIKCMFLIASRLSLVGVLFQLFLQLPSTKALGSSLCQSPTLMLAALTLMLALALPKAGCLVVFAFPSMFLAHFDPA